MVLHAFGFAWQIKFELQHLFAERFNKDSAQKYPYTVVLSLLITRIMYTIVIHI